MRHAFLLLVSLFLCFAAVAQNKDLEVKGVVMDKTTNQPAAYANVVLKKMADDAFVVGAITNPDGSFSLKTDLKKVYLEVSFLGYETLLISPLSFTNNIADLGQVFISEDTQTLSEVVVQAERSQTEFKLDKRVFNVGKDLSTTGASALEVLNNVPSVNVGIEGDISLRGSAGVKILINGKPSVLASEEGNALGTITADMIEKVEVITNPSAKYDAEGTSGIINIVLKKNEKKGLNGSVSINTGIPDNHSVGVSLNRRTEKFNIFSQLGVGYRSIPTKTNGINKDLIENTTILSTGEAFRNEVFYNFNLGTDYHINDYNVITLSGSYAFEAEMQESNTYFTFNDESTDLTTSESSRHETGDADNPKLQYQLSYKKDFKDHKDHDLLFSATGNSFAKDKRSSFDNLTSFGTEPEGQQQINTDFKNEEYTFNLDYTKPFNEQLSLEAGAQYVLSGVRNDYEVINLNNGQSEIDSSLTNVFDYNLSVLGVYATGAYEGEKFGVKLGLRAEQTFLETILQTTNERNTQRYANLFPSIHTSYKLSDKVQFQAGYSRRIFRPNLWSLNPFFNIQNQYSIRTGNPNLLPEFTDSYELNSIYSLGKLSLNLGVYQRYTTDVVERVSTFEDGVSYSMPINIGTNLSTGVELNGKYNPYKWLTFNGDFNYNYFNRDGEYEGTSFDFEADQCSARLTSQINLPADFDVEISGNYRSGFKTFQGRVSHQAFANLGLRKKIMKGKAIINLSVRDVLASRIQKSYTDQEAFYLYSDRTRGRFIVLGFSYGFGKGEAMVYSGRRR